MTYLPSTDFQTFFYIRLMLDQRKFTNSAPYRPPNPIFHFLVSPFLVFSFRTYSTQTPEILANGGLFYGARFFWNKIRCTPKAVGVRLKARIFPENKNVLRVSTPAEHDSGIKKLLRGQPKSIHVDFCEICPLTLKLCSMGFLDMGSTNIAKNHTMYSWWSTHRFFEKNRTLSQNIEIGYVGVLRRQGHKYGHKNPLSIIVRVYMSIKKKTIIPLL